MRPATREKLEDTMETHLAIISGVLVLANILLGVSLVRSLNKVEEITERLVTIERHLNGTSPGWRHIMRIPLA